MDEVNKKIIVEINHPVMLITSPLRNCSNVADKLVIVTLN